MLSHVRRSETISLGSVDGTRRVWLSIKLVALGESPRIRDDFLRQRETHSRYRGGQLRNRARLGAYSSGTPALRRPAKYVASNKAATFGTPLYPRALARATLE